MNIIKVTKLNTPLSKVDLYTDIENIIFEKKEFLRDAALLILFGFILGKVC
jgi:hypothetical protein